MSVPSTHTVHRPARRRCAVMLLLAWSSATLVLGAGPASAVPFEGDPARSQCVRLVKLPGAEPAGGSSFVSHGYALVLRSGQACARA